MHIFHLKKGHEKRFKAGHPWVFSNEINDGLKKVSVGELVELRDYQDEFRARGYGNPHKLNNDTKTFDHQKNPVMIEGWGNFSLIDGETPFIHMHGVYTTADKKRLGGHYIMDEQTLLPIETAELTLYPIPALIRSVQKEDFPTWNLCVRDDRL